LGRWPQQYHDGIFGKLVYNNFVWRFLLSGQAYSVSFVLSNNIWVVCSQLLSVEGILFLQWKQSRHHGGLSPPKLKHYKSVQILPIFSVKPPY